VGEVAGQVRSGGPAERLTARGSQSCRQGVGEARLEDESGGWDSVKQAVADSPPNSAVSFLHDMGLFSGAGPDSQPAGRRDQIVIRPEKLADTPSWWITPGGAAGKEKGVDSDMPQSSWAERGPGHSQRAEAGKKRRADRSVPKSRPERAALKHRGRATFLRGPPRPHP
jgi:hypothetical protein